MQYCEIGSGQKPMVALRVKPLREAHAGVRPLKTVEDYLLANACVREDQLAVAKQEQQAQGKTLSQILLALGFVDENTLARAHSISSGWPLFVETTSVDAGESLAKISSAILGKIQAFPINASPEGLTCAIVDASNLEAISELHKVIEPEQHLRFVIATPTQIDRLLKNHVKQGSLIHNIIRRLERAPIVDASLVGELVEQVLQDAIDKRASDIHFAPEDVSVRILYRVDGVLQHAQTFHKKIWPLINNKIKVMANLDIAETRLPQDGRFRKVSGSAVVDCRIASHPTQCGENIVIRLLFQDREGLSLSALDMTEAVLSQLKAIADIPEGLVLVTGPTGSGKTTTLYALLDYLNKPGVHIMTLEDPIEYRLPHVRQTQVREGFGFAEGVRSMLRQDPDIMLIGEIRDAETAQMALQAALTGHKVFATLHTVDAIGAIQRLEDLGVTREWICGSVRAIISQRLLRKLCRSCCAEQDGGGQIQRVADSPIACRECSGTGYQGRFPVTEIMGMTPALEARIMEKASPTELKKEMRRQEGLSLWQAGMAGVTLGKTTLSELKRLITEEV